MTLYASSDMNAYFNPACKKSPHVKKKNEQHLKVDCEVCEPVIRASGAMFKNSWGESENSIPLTKEEQDRADADARAAASAQAHLATAFAKEAAALASR